MFPEKKTLHRAELRVGFQSSLPGTISCPPTTRTKINHREEGGQDAAHSSEIEVFERKSFGGEFSEEDSSNEVAGDDEEDVYS